MTTSPGGTDRTPVTVNRLTCWLVDRWRRETAKTVPARTSAAALRANRGLRARFLIWAAVVAAGIPLLDHFSLAPLIVVVFISLTKLAMPAPLAAATRLNTPFTDSYLDATWRALAGLLESEVADGGALISTRTIGSSRAVAVVRRDGPNLVVAVYPWRREVWVAIGEYEIPRLDPAEALPLAQRAVGGDYTILPGKVFRRGRPAWLLVPADRGRPFVGRRRRTARLADWETAAAVA
jgi:hypothetical protein